MSAGRFAGALSRPSGLWLRACDVVRNRGGLFLVADHPVLNRVLTWSWAIGPDAERRA